MFGQCYNASKKVQNSLFARCVCCGYSALQTPHSPKRRWEQFGTWGWCERQGGSDGVREGTSAKKSAHLMKGKLMGLRVRPTRTPNQVQQAQTEIVYVQTFCPTDQ